MVAPTMAWLDLHIATTRQLFNSMDPAPFRDRDLDPQVETYVREWAEEVPASARLGLRVTLGDEALAASEAAALGLALHDNFRRSARACRTRLRKLFRDGRLSLAIGVSFLAVAIFISDAAASRIANENYALLVQESVVIGGWVALWHPINIFLYDWWPIRAEARLFDRLAAAEMQFLGNAADLADWRRGDA